MDLITKTVQFLIYKDIIFTTLASIIGDGFQVPTFIQEPPSKLIFSNNTGSQISCSADGNPTPIVNWIQKDGIMISSVPGLRQTSGNGTLYFPPFLGQYYREDVHEGIYRCRASNPAGTILSRDVYIRAVVSKPYDIWIEGKEVFLGNVGFLRCFIPEHVRDFVSVTSWYRGDEILLPELADIGGRYIVTSGARDLFIRSVKLEDNTKKISCVTTNTLNGERKLSDPVQLIIKKISSNLAPRTSQKPIIEMFVDRGNDIHLPCNIHGNPLPVYSWFRSISDTNNLYPVPSSQRIIPSQTLLLIRSADERDSGKWVCKASNVYGEQKIEIRVYVNSYLSVHIHPQVQVVNSGALAIFNCSVTGIPTEEIQWFHDGSLIVPDDSLRDPKIKLLTPASLAVFNVGRGDKGIYQCIVTNKKTSAQAMSELKLGDILPELLYTFVEQNVRPGQHVSLKCSAVGSPPPQFTWLLDSQPIMDVSSLHRYAIGQYVDNSGDVISHLNITHVRTDDGGLYKCIATNTMGNVEHIARLNVFGPPYIRAMGPIKAVAGTELIINCPYSGYPIDIIQWFKGRMELLSNTRHEIFPIENGGSLKINQVDSALDSGMYTCFIRGRNGEEAKRDLQLIVNSPPVIEPFSFPKNLQENGRAQVSCSVTSGDMPVFFSWKKDGQPVSLALQVTEKKDDFYTLLVFKDITSRHSGKYTCFATNTAATVNFTSELLVRVAPKWIFEPRDTKVMLGNAVALKCDADGYPEPQITWYKGQDKTSKEFIPLQLTNSSLNIDFVTEIDESYYMCQANNGIGNTLKKIIHLDVNVPARFDHNIKNVSSRRNDPVVLNCLAKGDEPINIKWKHNDIRIDLNNYRFNIAEIKTGDGINSQLSISRSERHDSGLYKCIAENNYGKSEYLIYLAVQERPDIPTNFEIIEVNSRSLKLSWKRPFDGNSPVLSYSVQYQQLKNYPLHPSVLNSNNIWNNPYIVNITLPTIVSGVRSLDGGIREQATLTGLQPSTTYSVRMSAVNEIENSGFTDAISIKTQEEAPNEAPQNIQVQTGNPGKLVVTWQLPPKESWNGELIGYTLNVTEELSNTEFNFVNDTTTTMVTNSLTIDGWATTKTTVTDLKTFRKYGIILRAVNNFGAGPWSNPIYGTTMEGVPEKPPRNLSCSVISSQSVKISWLEPLPQYHGGILKGYKILYTPIISDIDISANTESKRTSNLDTYLHTLYKATNYSIRVLAYTLSGDGVSSSATYCKTDEDVPEPPAAIKAAALTADSILVSWLPPKHKNGLIQQYTVYTREAGRKGQSKSHNVRVDETGSPVTFQSRNLAENQEYEFWVSASTLIGEGEPTSVIGQSTNTRAPARIASFSQTIRKPVGTNLLLECIAVGNPTPRAQWFTRDRPVTYSPFYEVTQAGHLKIHSVEPSLSGNYTCSAKNLFGEDHVIYKVLAMKPPTPPQITVQYATTNSIRISWETSDDGGSSIQGFLLSYRNIDNSWLRVQLTPENNAHTITELKCGTQYILKMSAHNRVGDGQATDEINVWTKGKKAHEPDQLDLIQTNSSCINLQLSSWNDGGCNISHFSIEYRPMGDIRWTVVSSDVSNSEENRHHLFFCDLIPATWYQLRISATNEAGRSVAQYNFATTHLNGDRLPVPAYFPAENDLAQDIISLKTESNWLPITIIGLILIIAVVLIVIILRNRTSLCNSISDGYESRTIPIDLKEEHDRRNQVYTASPVKTVDKSNDSEMYEISPYATFSVSGGRTPSTQQAKTPTRGVTTSTLDYTVQFKTFGHPEGDNLNATAYPILQNSGFGHIKGKSSWHNQRYYNTDEDSTLSKSMTVRAGHSQIPATYRNKNGTESHSTNRSKSRGDLQNHPDSESDTSGSPINEFSNTPTYRVPIKNARDIFQPDSSTESNNDHSPVEKRANTPRHVTPAETRHRSKPIKPPRESQSMDKLRAGSNNSSDSEVNLEAGLRFRPPCGFTDSREFSETECDRDRALDLEVQRVMEKNENEELTSLLVRYKTKKDQEQQEYTIHV